MAPDLLSIHPWTLIPDRTFDFEVLVWDDRLMTSVPCIEPGQTLTRPQFDQLARLDVQRIYIAKKNNGNFRAYLSTVRQELGMDDSLPRLLKLTLLCETIRYELQDALEKCSLQAWVRAAYKCAEHFTDSVDNIQRSGKEITSVVRKDGGFITHSFNTGLYSYALAREMRTSHLDQKEAMVAGFLHDTGKLGLDPDYPDQLTIPTGYLSCESRIEQQSHCNDGFVALSKVSEITLAPLLASYQHHEQINALGYPVSLPGDGLPEISRIVAVANRLDGLLCDRRGREAVSRVVAWKLIEQECGTLWDEDVVQCLERILNRPLQNY